MKASVRIASIIVLTAITLVGSIIGQAPPSSAARGLSVLVLLGEWFGDAVAREVASSKRPATPRSGEIHAAVRSGDSGPAVRTAALPQFSGPYLGQKPPGMTPEVFAPGIVSLAEFIDFKGAFSPDGQEYNFYRHALPEIIPTLLFTKIENGKWTEPAPLPIAQGARTYHPCVSPDNKWLFFFIEALRPK